MSKYLVIFTVDGRRTEEVVSASNSLDARRIIEARYKGSKIIFFNVKLA